MADRVLLTGSSSASHTYGNIAEFIFSLILTKFPKDFFKATHISTKYAFREQKKYTDNARVELRKKTRPFIYIKPNFDTRDESLFLSNILLTNGVNGNDSVFRTSLLPLIKDSSNNFKLAYKINRDKISFDVTIETDSAIQQLDLYKNMINMISWTSAQKIDTNLESIIPKSIIRYISKIINMDIDETETSKAAMLFYLNQHSGYPLTYKIRTSTANDEYFMYYKTPTLLHFMDIAIDDGNRTGMSTEIYGITFKVDCEFNLPGAFLLLSSDPNPNEYKFELTGDSNFGDLIPIYTFNRLYEDPILVDKGYKLFFAPLFKTDDDCHGKEDSVNIADQFSLEDIEIIRKYQLESTPVKPFMFIVFNGNVELKEDLDYTINLTTLEITILKSNKYSTYRVMVYANMALVQNEKIEMHQATKTDQDHRRLTN